ncbi:MAG: hotdog domain-containing protein [Lentisphaeria bacterium]|jgi:acyl-CoA hydrolase|nr:hotdog domain-containing protein [Lentisphaeria bacterium]MDY0175999.1 hotdog domain-containing protein [Lentisphaeria bacterium]NLZ60633.1 acyl-CoA thioesterase [Lentisphaerota bacterium]
MNFYTIVRPEHLNHYNYLFGGVLLRWVDEFAYLAAVREFPAARFVTRAMHEIEFTKSVKNGAMLRFQVEREKCGITSVSYRVVVYARDLQEHDEYHVFENVVTLVSLTKEGEKTPLPKNVKT